MDIVDTIVDMFRQKDEEYTRGIVERERVTKIIAGVLAAQREIDARTTETRDNSESKGRTNR